MRASKSWDLNLLGAASLAMRWLRADKVGLNIYDISLARCSMPLGAGFLCTLMCRLLNSTKLPLNACSPLRSWLNCSGFDGRLASTGCFGVYWLLSSV